MNDFRESLKVNPAEISAGIDEEEFIERNTRNYVTLYNIPEVREYYTQVVTAILLAYNERFGNHGIQLNYRFKSPASIKNKMVEYVRDKHSNDESSKPSQPMYDGVAMTLITSEVPSLMYSRNQYRLTDKDKTLSRLVEERKANYEFLEGMQEFKSRLVEDEFEEPPRYKLDVSQEEYFKNCIEVLKRTKDLIDPSEKEIIANFDESIATMEEKLSVSYDLGTSDSPILARELDNPSTNFITFLDSFETKMHNELAMAVLTKQFTSLFKSNSEFFDALGMRIASPSTKLPKRKRTQNGYESNFIYIDTLFGTIEWQLQTYDQYEQGKTGTAAHASYKNGKNGDGRNTLPRPIPVPSKKDMCNPDVVNDFLRNVFEISPNKFSAKLGRDRVEDIEYGAFRNYYSVFSEIPPTHPLAPQFQQYFSVLRDRQDSPLRDFPDKLRQYNYQDVDDYIESEEFKYLQKIAELFHTRFDYFADIYASSIKAPYKSDVKAPINARGQIQIDFQDDGDR